MQGLLILHLTLNLRLNLPLTLRAPEMTDEKPKRKTVLRNFVFLAVTLAAIVYAVMSN